MRVLVIGAGQMERGIAQLCAQSGKDVFLFDAVEGIAEAALDAIGSIFTRLVEKGRMSQADAETALSRIQLVGAIEDAGSADLVIEAVVERVDIKTDLFKQVSACVSRNAIVATNTSSLSVTQLANAVDNPARFIGLHFFNPVPLMKLVEVIPGIHTSDPTVEVATNFIASLGHKSVRVTDTPGFLVNLLGRAYVTEAFRLIEEQVADHKTIDRVMREGFGFRMGPFELMDLTGLDVTHPATEAIYNGFYGEPRLRPSYVAAQRLRGGMLGRKSGIGFYAGQPAENAPICVKRPSSVALNYVPHDLEVELKDLCLSAGLTISSCRDADLILLVSAGEDPSQLSYRMRVDPERLAVISALSIKRSLWELSPCILTPTALVRGLSELFELAGQASVVCAESPGHIGDRILATIVNLAASIAEQGIAEPNDIDEAVMVALGYPYGPFSWTDQIGAEDIGTVLSALHERTGDPRYRTSPWMKRRMQLAVSQKTMAA